MRVKVVHLSYDDAKFISKVNLYRDRPVFRQKGKLIRVEEIDKARPIYIESDLFNRIGVQNEKSNNL